MTKVYARSWVVYSSVAAICLALNLSPSVDANWFDRYVTTGLLVVSIVVCVFFSVIAFNPWRKR